MSVSETLLVVGGKTPDSALLVKGLKDAGYTVEPAAYGETASVLRQGNFGVVLLDIASPAREGMAVLRRMKSDGALRRTPVVVVSAVDDMETVMRCLELGATDHLCKPIDAILLRTRIRAALATRRLAELRVEETRAAGTDMGEAIEQATVGPLDDEDDEDADEGAGQAVALFRCLGKRLVPYRRQAAIVMALMLVCLSLEAALPLGLKFITDYALVPHDLAMLTVIVAVLGVGGLIAAATRLAFDHYYAQAGTKLLNDLRYAIYRQLGTLSASYYGRTADGDLISRFTSDLSAVENTVMFTMPLALSEGLLVIFGVFILFALEWKLAVFSLMGLYASFKLGQWIEPSASRASYRMRREQGNLAAAVQERVSTQGAVRSLCLESMLSERFKRMLVRFHGKAYKGVFLSFMTERVPERSIILFGVLTVCVGAFLTYHGMMTIGSLVSFQVLLMGLEASAGEVTWGFPLIVQAGAGMRRIEEFLEEQPEVVDAPGATVMPPPCGDVALDSVTFGYAENQVTLADVSLTVPHGQSVLFVGPSGCGKSTTLNLLMRFYDPVDGRVTIDGTDIRQFTQESLRRHIGIVLQDSILFNTSIRENIRMGKLDATDDEVVAAAKAAEVHDVIMGMPDVYDTVVGERGGRLSGGQRQRVAIARAIISNPPILLLDEATSALDPGTATAINESLERLAKNRTVISVTHRLESAPNADRVFVFKEGQLAESGHHTDLLDRNGLYAQLWRKQSGFVVEPDGAHARVEPERLGDIPLLSHLDESSRAELAELFATEHYVAQGVVVHEGDPGDRFYIIVRGRLAVSKRGEPGEEHRAAVLEDGDYFGEIALIRSIPRTATVTALSDTILLGLSQEHFGRLLEKHPALRNTMEEAAHGRIQALAQLWGRT